MKLRSFFGGIHPQDYKYLTANKKIETPSPPKRVYLPLQQHLGVPCEARIKVGQRVRKGELIADNQAFVSAPVHASISGTVIEIKDYVHPTGREISTIIIDSDGLDEWYEQPRLETDPLNLAPEEMLKRVRAGGIVGLGGAAFPTHVKLCPPKEKPIEAVILNGVECEPYLTADHQLMLAKAEGILTGLRIMMKILGVQRGYIGIEANKPDALAQMRQACASFPGLEVIGLKVKYPQGAEKQLVKAILNREIPPPPGLPMDVGVVIQNVGTAFALYEAVAMKKPLIERVVTVTGRGVKEPKNLLLRLGTLFSEAINYCGGFQKEVGKILMGGPMMGLAQYTTTVPVIKGTSGIVILSKEEIKPEEPRHCINCGMCVRACPMRLVPSSLGTYCEKDLLEEAESSQITNCIECGSCVYVCPAKRPLVHLIKYGKNAIMIKKRKK